MRKNLTVKAIDARLPGRHNPAQRAIADVGAIEFSATREIARAWLEQITAGIDPKAEPERTRQEASQKPELFA